MSELGGKMTRGAAWMVLFKIMERGLGLVSTVILARLLVPSDFGLIAMAASIMAILELLSAFGFDMALIQKQDAERRHYDTAWTFNVIFATSSALLLMLLSIPAASFYLDERLTEIILVLAIGAFIQGFENIGVVAFRKELRFNEEFRFLVSKKLIAFSVTVPLAFLLQSYWALVIGIVSGRLGGVTLSYVLHEYRPRLCLSAWRDLFGFSKWLLFNNILTFLRQRSADFVVGRLSGARGLGFFSVAQEVSELPTVELVMPINRAIYPAYAKLAHDPKALRRAFVDVISMLSLVAMPAGAGVSATAELLVPVALGSKWLEAIPLVQILAFYGIAAALQTNLLYIYIAKGQPRIGTLITAAYVSVLLPLLLSLANLYGVEGAAWAYLLTAWTFIPVNYFILHKFLGLRLVEMLSAWWRPVVATSMMYWAVIEFVDRLATTDSLSVQILHLTSAVLVGVLTYATIIVVLWLIGGRPAGPERAILDRARGSIGNRLGGH